MPVQIKIVIADVVLEAQLFDTECAKAIVQVLPIEARLHEWGDEFYFEIPVKMPPDETATIKVEMGDIGYWPPGRALAIFFGPTPMSRDQAPVPASEVNLVGKITDDAVLLRKTKGAARIRIERGQ